MSIINDALKKVQQGLSHKTEKPEVIPPSGTTQKGDDFVYSTAPTAPQQTVAPKKSYQNKIKPFFLLMCSLAIIAGSWWYLYQQFHQDIPKVQRFAKKSFYKLIHKEEIPDFKSRAPEDLVPLAQITIPAATVTPAPAPLTLNVHGIMANASGNVALINDRVCQEGDEVDGAKIIKINLDSITVNINGTEKTILVKN